ncbi:DEAD/DEAH box helicase [Candidatus Viridilinea mediisalina]|uniref:Serine/threonine protein kinase n=1 Tax=Candidatus Viridilinea mediisalina TaxID=2024553 RepID=A0A2A6RET7_9CHLR|nr:DEAD/DEAH box helicase [Candidatus Viridilinea mediisalina]PDW01209.1 serine/threonine protein kinase [Candidatus Viridilinea mediisalina]
MLFMLTAEALVLEKIFQYTQPKVVKEGRELFKQGHTRVHEVSDKRASVDIEIPGQSAQRVVISLNASQLYVQCNCRSGYGWGMCSHRVAAIVALRDHLQANPPSIWRAVLNHAVQTPIRRYTPSTINNIIIFSLQQRRDNWSLVPYTVNVRSMPKEYEGDFLKIGAWIDTQPGLAPRVLRSSVDPGNFPLVPAHAVIAANTLLGGSYGHWQYGTSSHNLSTALGMLHHDALVYHGAEDEPMGEGRLVVHEQSAKLQLQVQRNGDGIDATFHTLSNHGSIALRPQDCALIASEPVWLLVQNELMRIVDASPNLQTLINYSRLRIPNSEEAEFLDHYLLPISEQVRIDGDVVQWEDLQIQPQPRIYLSEREGELVAELRFGYEQFEFPFEKQPPAEHVRRRPGAYQFVRVKRDETFEQTIQQQIATGHGLKRGANPHEFALRKNVTPADFLLREVPKLAASGITIFGEEALTMARVNRNRPSISFNVNSGVDWFDVQAVVSFGDQMLPIKELRRALKRRDRYVKLTDGSLGVIPEDWAARYKHLFAFSEEREDGMRLASHHIVLLDQLLAEADRSEADEAFNQRRERLKSFDRLESKVLPQHFTGELRPYQKAGYDWLHFLRHYQFGGCLADDMGTGKTIQTLAFLQSIYEEQPRPAASLLVMPRSLLFNWQREAQQFTPKLRLYVHADQGRISAAQEFGEYDLILTTYGVMLRDIELLRGYNFHYTILDESQAIKNPVAATSRAARALCAEHRLVLTGTPVENSTLELWSQFAFLNPGLLGNLDYFREEFAAPIERKQDMESASFLRKMVYPFILRRTKDQVALDLPPRTEELLVTEMEPAQRKLYNKTRDYYRALLLGMIDDEGLSDARMKILEGLLRLRQICNHPRLIDSKFRGNSAKFELLIETLETLRAEGHKALIFSQFVQMLSLIRESLDEQKIPYAYLDGSTRDRQGVVDRFQNDPELPFFLISLKAGGVGLNLTAAEYVIHVDPWWNPAVEMQATDRTHRIGQTKPVFVYKLITRDTVEEKILKLQDQKRALVEQLISSEGGVFKSLTRDDVEVLFS